MATLLRLPQALEFSGLKRTTFLTMVKAGHLPAPVQISAKCVAWRREELEAWAANLPKKLH